MPPKGGLLNSIRTAPRVGLGLGQAENSMSAGGKGGSVRAPLMGVFRSAHEAHDATKREDRRDESGDRVIAGRRSHSRNAISETELQAAVARDLEVLMNTVNLASSIDLSEFGEVDRSVLNYGFPDLVHRTIDEGSLVEVGDEIQTALSVFEPRLVPGSVSVVQDERTEEGDLKVRFIVRAALRYDPYNVPVEFVADIERESGKILIGRG